MADPVADSLLEYRKQFPALEDCVHFISHSLGCVPAKAMQAVDAKREELQSGKWDVFMGPIKDQSGAVKIAAGQNLTDPELQRINWYVEGVDGSLPK